MTQNDALALARIVANVDDVPLLDPIRVEQRPRLGRSQTVWSIFSHHDGPGRNAGFTIDDRTGVVLRKEYIGFGARGGPSETREFIGETHSAGETILEREQWLPAERHVVFRFFIDSDGQRALRTTVLEPVEPLSVDRDVGSHLAWRARLCGRTFESTLRVDELRASERLVETQEKGPFRQLRHVVVAVEAAGGTLVRERLAYKVPWGVVGELAAPLIGLNRTLEDALEARFAIAIQRFGPVNAATPSAH
jgi:ligand-binding SRPBCC domain-containing protein